MMPTSLQGILSIKSLLKARPEAHVRDLVNTDFVYVKAEMDQEDVAGLISQYNLTTIPGC